MCDDCGWEELGETIEELLGDDDMEWAESTLSGIGDWITEHEHCTDAQRTAVDNIAEKRK